MKRLLPPMIALTFSALTLVACGKNGGGSNGSKSAEKITVSEYKDLLKGKFQSPKGEIEFNENQFRERVWMEVRHATEYYENDFYVNCEVERKGTFKVVKSEEGPKLKIDVKDFIIHGAKASGRGEDVSGFSQEKLKRLCSGVMNKFKSIDANLISVSKNHVHFIKDEDYSEYDYSAEGYKVNFSEVSDDYSHFYIKGESLNVTQMFGQLYAGEYSESQVQQAELSISLDLMSGELSYKQSSEKCSSEGTFKVFYGVKKGLEFRFDQANPCAQNSSFNIIDLSYGDEDFIYFNSPFGYFSKIISRVNNPRIL